MKQNELFNKCCENIDPKTREEVWKQMDKELGREENRGNSSKIPSNSPKQELEQAAIEWVNSLGNGTYGILDAFKAGAEWQKKQDEEELKSEEKLNHPLYLEGFDTGREVQKVFNELTWKDIVELEGIINQVHYDFSAGIGQESFGKEVLERFRSTKV